MLQMLTIMAPMSAEAWRRLATCLEEAEEGLVEKLEVEDEAARVGEREAVRSCCKRAGRILGWGGLSLRRAEEFSEDKFSEYWERILDCNGDQSRILADEQDDIFALPELECHSP